MGLLGAALDRVEKGRVEISVPFRAQLSQQHGFFHAGVISTLADSAGGYAGFTLFPAEAGASWSVICHHLTRRGRARTCGSGRRAR